MTEHLYDRENPKSNLRYKGTGIEGLFYGVPNINERAEMIARAVAKQSDGDLTKFVMQSQKPRDVAQKWRTFKNFARFFKNPIGYAYWKMQPLHKANRVRFIWVVLVAQLYCSFVAWVGIKNKKESMITYWMHSVGQITKEQGLPHNPKPFPADRHKNYLRYSNFHQKLRNKRTSMIWTSWWCRDQNFRKYFEMRKKHGIKPSLSGFAHEEIYKNYRNAQISLHAKNKMRDTS